MKFRIETPGFKASPSLKSFVKEKAGNLDRYYKDIQETEVTLINEIKRNKDVVVCTINFRLPGKDEYVKANSSIFEDAVLKAVDAAKQRLSMRKTKLQAAKKKSTPNRKKNLTKGA